MPIQTILDIGVRPDLAAAQAETMHDLAGPGDWLDSHERVALVEVVRAASQSSEQPPWYRPSTDADFDTARFGPLSASAIDAAWRLTNHPGTLTADWYAETVKDLPSPEYYVELVGVVAVVNAMDRLADSLAVAVLPIPEARAGEPSRATIPSAIVNHWVPIALDAEGPNVLKASSISPSAVALRTRMGAACYMTPDDRADPDWSRGTLDRCQIELLAGITSKHNECFY